LKDEQVKPPPKTAFAKGGDVGQNAAMAAADVYALDSYATTSYALLQSCARLPDGP